MATNISNNQQIQQQPTHAQQQPPKTPPTKKDRLGFADKTLWDWLQLLAVLAVPLAVGIASLVLSFQQANLAQKQHDSDQAIAVDQQRQQTVNNFISTMDDLLFTKGLRASKPGDEVRVMARTETLITLRQLDGDGDRKGIVMQFILEAGLITGKDAIIDLAGADLGGTDLSDADLSGVDLSGADLNHTFFINTKLIGTNLSGANLTGAQVTTQQLAQASSLSHAIMPDGSQHP